MARRLVFFIRNNTVAQRYRSYTRTQNEDQAAALASTHPGYVTTGGSDQLYYIARSLGVSKPMLAEASQCYSIAERAVSRRHLGEHPVRPR